MTELAITGFQSFPGVPDNPSERLIAHLRQSARAPWREARFHILPTRYDATHRVIERILRDPPRLLLMTGYSALADGLKLEAGASDICSPKFADAAGFLPLAAADFKPRRIANPSIDTRALARRLKAEGVACSASDDAGEYVCNNLYFRALEALSGDVPDGRATHALFVHIPALAGSTLAASSASAMTPEELERALAILVRVVLDGDV